MSKLKKEFGIDEEPTLENFFRFLKHHYGREVHYGEITFSSYWVNGVEVQSDPVLFCRLSEKFYAEIHNVPNPVKDGELGLKKVPALKWVWYKNNGISNQELIEHTMNEDEEFNAEYESCWKEIIEDGNFARYNRLCNIDKDQ